MCMILTEKGEVGSDAGVIACAVIVYIAIVKHMQRLIIIWEIRT